MKNRELKYEDIDELLKATRQCQLDCLNRIGSMMQSPKMPSRPVAFNKFQVKNTYFAGRTLFIDRENDYPITLCHTDETYGSFEGGIRKLMSLDSLRTLEEIMEGNDIKYKEKEVLWI